MGITEPDNKGGSVKTLTIEGDSLMSDAKFIKTNAADAKALSPDGGKRLALGPGVDMIFKVSGDEVDGLFDYFEIRVGHLGGPPLHSHPAQHETFHVIEGELTIKVGDQMVEAKAGDYVYIPKGIVHGYINLKEGTTARAVCNVAPGGFDKYMEELSQYMSTAHPPDQAKINEISAKYGQVFGGPPLAVSMGLRKGR
jgi:mannose-6-phosphate isomerase-like protein (cupin superfamily)